MLFCLSSWGHKFCDHKAKKRQAIVTGTANLKAAGKTYVTSTNVSSLMESRSWSFALQAARACTNMHVTRSGCGANCTSLGNVLS